MAKHVRPSRESTAKPVDEETLQKIDQAIREYGLVDDVVFDPPLMPDERRRRGVGFPIDERIEQAQRQGAEGLDKV